MLSHKSWSCISVLSLAVLGICLQSAAEEKSDAKKPAISPAAELAARAIQVPDGFSLKTVASEPNVANGVSFCFDPTGRIFVAETYRVGKGIEDDRSHMDWLDDDLQTTTVAGRIEYLKRHLGDKVHKFEEASEQVRLLEDRDGDGVYETSSIFSTGYKNIEDGTAAGVLWSKNRLLFTCIPSLWELQDKDGDGKAESRRELATGFGVRTSFYGHDLHGLCEGPDGKIYFSIGDRGLNVKTSDGRQLVNPQSGAVLRCKPDGSELEIFATGLRNPQELAFNEFGDLFTVDNNSDSGDKARLVHIVEGMDAGWRMPFQYLADRGPFNREKIWEPQNDDQPASIVPPVANITDGPSGLVHYPGTGLTAAYDGDFFIVDFRGAPATSGVRQFHIEPQGASYRLTDYKTFVGGILASDCDFGPNGDFYILDWVEGWSGPGVGRIQRITCNDANAAKQRAEMVSAMQSIRNASVADLVALLGHPNMRVRQAAQAKLVDVGAKSLDALKEVASKSESPLFSRFHAIWALGELAESDAAVLNFVSTLLEDENPDIRAQAVRVLEQAARCDQSQRDSFGKKLLPLLGDSSPRVRCFAAIALGKLKYQPSLSALLEMAAKDGNDPTLRHAIASALSESHSAEALDAASKQADDVQRLVLVVALGKQKSPLAANFLHDSSSRVALEAARVIWDAPVPAAYHQLAEMIDDTHCTSEPLLRRALAANVAGRTPENLRSIIRFACRENLSPALRTLAWGQVHTWATPSPRDSVNGDWRPLEPRSATELSDALQDSMPQLVKMSAKNPEGLVVAAEASVESAFAPLLAVESNDAQPEAIRIRAIAAFGKASDHVAHQAIDAGIKSPSDAVRSATRKLWAERFPSQVFEQLTSALETGTTHERQAAVDTLATLNSEAASAKIRDLFEQLEKGDCPPELQVEVLEAASKSKDEKVADREKRFLEKKVADGPLEPFRGCISGGDADRGRKIFETNDTFACRRCHSIKPNEVLVGPCLANVGSQRKPEDILESIVAPNAKICEGFETAVLQLDSGKIVTGIIRHETDSKIEVVDANAKTIEVDPATVEDRVKGKSPMPENLMNQMSRRELRDLVAFLSQLKTAEPAAAGAASK